MVALLHGAEECLEELHHGITLNQRAPLALDPRLTL